MFLPIPSAPLRIVVVAAALAAMSCRSSAAEPTQDIVPNASGCCQAGMASAQQQALGQARRAAERAARDVNTNREIDDWAECARDASRAIDAAGKRVSVASRSTSNSATCRRLCKARSASLARRTYR